MPLGGHVHPLLVETHEYRPTKVEGNPQHGASLGSSDLFAQASILDLYDPDRSINLTFKGEPRPWGEFLGSIRGRVQYHKSNQGAGLRFLGGATSSPTFASQMAAIQKLYPQSKWHRWEPVHRDSARQGARQAFGAYIIQSTFDAADVVVSLDGDFLSGIWFPGFVRYSRDFMSRRKSADKNMNRLYVAETTPTTTGAKADHRIPVTNSEMQKIARALASSVGAGTGGGQQFDGEQGSWIMNAARELLAHRGKCLVVAGVFQSAEIHALAHAMNASLGNVGQTVSYIDPVEADPVEHTESIRELANDIAAGKVETLILLGGNPVFDAPADLNFGDALKKMAADQNKQIIQLSIYKNETTDYCVWHVPQTHYLEAWSDGRSYDGAATIIQPMIAPLYDGKSAHEIIAIFTDQPSSSGYDLVQAYWRSQHSGDDFEAWWRRTLHDGYVSGSAFPLRQVAAKGGAPAAAPAAMAVAGGTQVEVMFRPDPTIYDGTFVNNGWLQETPKPLSRTTWDNVIFISPAMAKRLGFFVLEQGPVSVTDLKSDTNRDHQSDQQNVIEVTLDGRKVKGPVWPQPGHPDNAITIFLGYGRTKTGRVGTGTGYNAYQIRSTAAQYASMASIVVTKDHWDLAITQGHFTMDNREPVKVADLEEFEKNPHFAHEEGGPKDTPAVIDSLYPDFREKNWYKNYAWGMAIDLNSASAATPAQSPATRRTIFRSSARSRCMRGRDMQWIRIDTYFRRRPPRSPNGALPADDVHALRERAVRAGLPGRRNGSQHGRPE